MKVKYIRWSTLQQTGARQNVDKSQYDLILQEQVSGAVKMADRVRGGELLKLIADGKVTELYVEELTRLGRNPYDVINTLQLCEDNKVNVIILNMGLSSMIDGKPNTIFKMITYLLSCVAQQEREVIRERTEAGKIAARAKGVIFGRPTGSNEQNNKFLAKEKNKKISALLKKEIHSIRQIAAITGTSNATVQKVKKLITKSK